MKLKKVISCLLSLAMVCSMLAVPQITKAQEDTGTARYYYVSNEGSDTNDGSEASPFKTLEAARDAIRAEGVPQGGVTVYVRGGVYTRSETFTLTDADKGSADSPIIYAAYPGEEVVFSGAVQLDNSKFQTVTDESIIDRLPDASKVLVYDLKAENIPTGEIPRKMLYQPEEPEAPEVFVDNQVQVLSRYPNVNAENPDAEYMEPAEVVVAGFNSNDHEPGHPFGPGEEGHIPSEEWYKQTPPTFRYSDERMDKWEMEHEPFISGYFRFDWYATQLLLDMEKFDTEENLITTAYPPHYGVKSEKDGLDGAAGLPKFYGFNLLCELDTVGEYYIDRTPVDGEKTDKLYLYVGEEGLGDKKVEITVLGNEIISMDGAEYITFRGFKFTKNQSDAVSIRNSESCTIADSEIYDNGGWGVYIDGGHNNVVDGCLIHGTAVGGVYMNGGDFTTLTPAGHIVKNCEFYEFARVKRTYSPAVEARGVGQTISRNYIYDGPHNAILFGGNDHVIEFNEIENVLYETGDAGAIYCGKEWTSRGNVIRYNYLHDIPNPSTSTYGVYLDDAFSSAEVYGNIFENFEGTACIMGGGRDNLFHDNIYINIEGGVYNFDARTFDWFNVEDGLVSGYESMPITNEYWSEKYPELAETSGHLVVAVTAEEKEELANAENPDLKNPMYPAGNKVYGEVIVSSSIGSINVMVQKWGEIDMTPPTYENSQSALEIYKRTLKNITTTASAEDLEAAKAEYLANLNAAERDIILKGTPVVDGVLDDMYKESTQLKFNPVYNDTISWAPTDQGDNTGDLYILWDNDYLYVYAIVNDAEVMTNGSEYVLNEAEPNPWWNDAVEIFTNNNKVSVDAFGMRTFSDGKTTQLTEEVLNALPRAAVFMKDGEIIQNANELDLKNLPAGYTVEGANGYAVEMAIPVAIILGKTPEVGDSVIVQVQNNDLVEYTKGATPEEDTSVFYYSMNDATTYTLGVSSKTPGIAEGMETQTGEAVPASQNGSVAAVPYSQDLAKWFVNNSENPLSYELVFALASGDAADVSAQVKIDGAVLTYTPSPEDAGKTVTIQVRATDGVWSSEPVTVSVQVAQVPADALDTTAIDEAITRAEAAKQDIAISKDGKDVPKDAKWVTQEVMDAFNAAVEQAKQAKAGASSQEELTAAAEKLDQAIRTFEAAKADGASGSASDAPKTGEASNLLLPILLLLLSALCGSAIWMRKRKAL